MSEQGTAAPRDAAAWLYRTRYWIHTLVYVLGLSAPWDLWLHLDGTGPNAHVWSVLSIALSRTGALGISAAFDVVLVVGIVCATAAAWLRTWGAAYLGPSVVQDGAVRTERMVVDGPYRRMRNPLYLGTILHTLALALLMPASGALFAVGVLVPFQWFLILREERYLRGTMGAAYVDYCARVPRMLPALRARVERGGAQPRWGAAAVSEIYMWGVAASFAVAGWWYNASLLIRCVVVSFGVSLVARGLGAKGRAAE